MSDQIKNIPSAPPAIPPNAGLPTLQQDSNESQIVSAMWNISPQVFDEIQNVSKVVSSKHGMFASVPILCQEKDCTFIQTCMVKPAERKIGQRCPMEIAAIMSRFSQYCQHFDIDMSMDMINPKDLVDVTLIKDLVNMEVAQMRVENKIAINGDFMAETLLDIDKKCQPYFGKVVSPEMQLLMTLQEKKTKVMNQLNATRKDKISSKNVSSPTTQAIAIFKEMSELSKQGAIVDIADMDFDVYEDLDDDGSVSSFIAEGEGYKPPRTDQPEPDEVFVNGEF